LSFFSEEQINPEEEGKGRARVTNRLEVGDDLWLVGRNGDGGTRDFSHNRRNFVDLLEFEGENAQFVGEVWR
jgi:hypothetical protein